MECEWMHVRVMSCARGASNPAREGGEGEWRDREEEKEVGEVAALCASVQRKVSTWHYPTVTHRHEPAAHSPPPATRAKSITDARTMAGRTGSKNAATRLAVARASPAAASSSTCRTKRW